MPKTLTRAAIFKKCSLKEEVLKVPEWGGDVTVRELTGSERDAWEASILNSSGEQDESSMTNARAKLCVRCLVDEEGQLLFSQDDVDQVGELSGSALSRIFNVASRLSGLRPGDIEELAGN